MITALLGPTNTGKTHRAIERMLDFPSGMMGLPLRLLAREVYDRVAAKVGEAKVALITGEEKRVPEWPAYWICTVEAMPMSRQVDFVAIDEVQLAAHDQRGHVFTDRLLYARGTQETWFLGSDTMRDMLALLVPEAQIISHPRLSALSFAGMTPLSRLPPRTAVVAFSMSEVYALAERIRVGKGGAAVVLGALSPRTRNAQVAMFQAGEVDYLVATDAIGMGLNLQVQHVAFAALDKFDGRSVRRLETAEMGQIAGRAGRFLQNGSFGTIAPVELPLWAAKEVETQKFSAVDRVRWRAHDLDFSSVDALIVSLRQPPSQRVLLPMFAAEDLSALQALAPRVRTPDEASVRLLWDVCGVPDFRKLLFEAHIEDLEAIFTAVQAHGGRVPSTWMEARAWPLEDSSGDVETLTARIAALRTWAYVANHGSWLDDPRAWQEWTRAAEDALSDALHAQLVERFVVHKRKRAGSSFAALKTLRDQLAAQASGEIPTDEWTALLLAPDERFLLSDKGDISVRFGERSMALAALSKGRSLSQPGVRLLNLPLDGPKKQRLEKRLVSFVRHACAALLQPLDPLARADSHAVRALGHALQSGLGATTTIPKLTARDRDIALSLGVTFTQAGAVLKAMQSPTALTLRRALLHAFGNS